MAEVDQVAAARAMLEMMIADNKELQEYFRETLEKLEAIEALPPGIKRVQFRQLQDAGGLKFNGADIRLFSEQSGKRTLSPPQFLQRTNRRLRNTNALIDAFLNHESFEGGKELREQIELLTNAVLDVNDPKSVVTFRDQVEKLRSSDEFTNYNKVKLEFVKKNEDLRVEAEVISTKEVLADGEEMAQERGEELEELQQKMVSGEISPEEAQNKMDVMEGEDTNASEPSEG